MFRDKRDVGGVKPRLERDLKIGYSYQRTFVPRSDGKTIFNGFLWPCFGYNKIIIKTILYVLQSREMTENIGTSPNISFLDKTYLIFWRGEVVS